MRYRITINVDTTDPDLSADDLADAAGEAVEAICAVIPADAAYVDLDAIEELGT
jgi:hypothetical protein